MCLTKLPAVLRIRDIFGTDPDPRNRSSDYLMRIREAEKHPNPEHLHNSSKIKSNKEVRNIRKQGFSYYFCLMIEG